MQSTRHSMITAFLFAAIMAQQNSLSADSPRFLFGPAQLVEGISTPGVGEGAPSPTPDELELFFNSNSGQGVKTKELFVARRESKDAPFDPPLRLDTLNSRKEIQPSISIDALTLYYISGEPNDNDFDIAGEVWSATRPSRNEPFGHPTLLFSPEPGWGYYAPSVSSDELSLYVQYSYLSGGDADVYVSRRPSVRQAWGELEPVPELSDPNHWQSRPFLSADSLSFFFYDNYDIDKAGARPGGADLAVMVRPSVEAPWSVPVNLGNAINTKDYEDFARLAPDGRTLYFDRRDASASDDPSFYNSDDIWQSSVLPFEAVSLSGAGGGYAQDFDVLGANSGATGTPLPSGWTFTANDIIFNNATTDKFPASRRNYAGVYNGGVNGDSDRALVTDVSLEEGGELDFRAVVAEAPVQALRLGFDLEAWQVFGGADQAEAAFHVVLEADTGDGFSQVADLGMVTTGPTLTRPPTGSLLVDGNDPAYRVNYDSGPLDVDVPQDATLRVRWISTEASRRTIVFGLDNVSLIFAGAGDANVDGLFNSADLVQIFTTGEYEDAIVGNSTWADGDWNQDHEFDSTDLVVAFQGGRYEQGAKPMITAVPEPYSSFLGWFGLSAISVGWRRGAMSRLRQRR